MAGYADDETAPIQLGVGLLTTRAAGSGWPAKIGSGTAMCALREDARLGFLNHADHLARDALHLDRPISKANY
jgi:hypothetical protein